MTDENVELKKRLNRMESALATIERQSTEKMASRQGAMDIAATSVKVVQEQERTIGEIRRENQEMKLRLDSIEKKRNLPSRYIVGIPFFSNCFSITPSPTNKETNIF